MGNLNFSSIKLTVLAAASSHHTIPQCRIGHIVMIYSTDSCDNIRSTCHTERTLDWRTKSSVEARNSIRFNDLFWFVSGLYCMCEWCRCRRAAMYWMCTRCKCRKGLLIDELCWLVYVCVCGLASVFYQQFFESLIRGWSTQICIWMEKSSSIYYTAHIYILKWL